MAKRSDGRTLFRKAASKNSLLALLITASSIIEMLREVVGNLIRLLRVGHFQITNVHPDGSYGFQNQPQNAAQGIADWKAPPNIASSPLPTVIAIAVCSRSERLRNGR